MNIIDIASEYNDTHDLRPATRTIYLAAARALTRRFGDDVELEKLHHRDVLIWRKEALDSGLAKRSWNTYASHLKTLFGYAISQDLLTLRKNPFTDTSVVPPRKRKKLYLTRPLLVAATSLSGYKRSNGYQANVAA